MTPFEQRSADARSLLEDERAEAALDEMRRGSKSDRAGADDRHGKIDWGHHVHYVRSF